MTTRYREAHFQRPLAPLMEQFVQEKRACGYKYRSSAQLLSSFDRYLSNEALPPGELPRSITRTSDLHGSPVCPVHVPAGLSC